MDRYGLRERIELNTEINGGAFDEESDLWEISTADGRTITARFVVGATGVFSQPKAPDIDGLDSFAGTLMHTARWDHSQELRGRRVAIVGTGASAVQVIPSIAPQVEHLTVFQRTPIWCLPKPDKPRDEWRLDGFPGAGLLRRVASQAFVELTFPLPAHFDGVLPLAKLGERTGRKHLRNQVHDPEVRDKLTPRYGLGCKRPGFSNDYLPTFNRENVTLVTDRIEQITPGGLRTADGGEHEVDTLILATGFKVFDRGNMPPYPVLGRSGLDLERFWDENRFQAYEGVSVPGFPNLFSILGPYAFNGSSYFNLIEHQSRHIARVLKRARKKGATSVEVKPEANRRYFEAMLARRKNQVFFKGSCGAANSYYFDRHGDVPFRASPTPEVAWRSARFDLDDYVFA